MILVRMQMGRSALAVAFAVAVAVSGAATSAEGRADARVTLGARPTALAWGQGAMLFGAVDSGREGEIVTIEAKDCGLTSFTEMTGVETHAGGTWTLERYASGVNTVLRATWKGAVSAPVSLRQAPRLQLDRRSARKFEVGVASKGQMWRKRVLFQRRQGGSWTTVKSVVLAKTAAAPPGQAFVWTEAEFSASVPRGSLVRAVLPLAQAKPCYLPTVSNTVRA